MYIDGIDVHIDNENMGNSAGNIINKSEIRAIVRDFYVELYTAGNNQVDVGTNPVIQTTKDRRKSQKSRSIK